MEQRNTKTKIEKLKIEEETQKRIYFDSVRITVNSKDLKDKCQQTKESKEQTKNPMRFKHQDLRGGECSDPSEHKIHG